MVVIIAVLFLLGSFSAYVLHCSPAPEGSISRAVRSLRRLGAPPRGLDPGVVETFPTVVYSAVKGNKIGEASLECVVCLNDFEDDDTLRLIPKCDHAFHPDCIGEWLASHTTCPVCRADLEPQPADDPESQKPEEGTEPPSSRRRPRRLRLLSARQRGARGREDRSQSSRQIYWTRTRSTAPLIASGHVAPAGSGDSLVRTRPGTRWSDRATTGSVSR
ncbi:hypothetical protein BT93_G0074 [Corymbia citriodora subsp. variegata]|nr:hypothetical protein BT93_G0074 [Corymbia citriodora subsp. variegata]